MVLFLGLYLTGCKGNNTTTENNNTNDYPESWINLFSLDNVTLRVDNNSPDITLNEQYIIKIIDSNSFYKSYDGGRSYERINSFNNYFYNFLEYYDQFSLMGSINEDGEASSYEYMAMSLTISNRLTGVKTYYDVKLTIRNDKLVEILYKDKVSSSIWVDTTIEFINYDRTILED